MAREVVTLPVIVRVLCHVARRSGKVSRRSGKVSHAPERVTRARKVAILTGRRHAALVKYRVQNRHAV